jgi:hypothetical protein
MMNLAPSKEKLGEEQKSATADLGERAPFYGFENL